MRKLLCLGLIWGLVVSVRAQMPVGQDTLYGVEWIQPGQPYLKFPVAADGFYRVTYEELLAHGWPVAEVTAQQYQLFHEGKPVFFHSSTAWDQALAAGDYLLFYGEQNRGELDAFLFRDPDNQQLNPQYSLHTDTAAYFLSWSEAVNPHRFETLANDVSNLPAAEPYIWREERVVFNDHFLKEYYRISGSTLYYSHMSIGEGYGSRSVNQLLQDGSTRQTVNLELADLYSAGPTTRLRTRYVAALFAHDQQLSVNGIPVRRDSFQNWRLWNVDLQLPVSSRAGEQLEVEWEGFGGARDEVSVGFVQADYPAIPRWPADQWTFSARLDASTTRRHLRLTDFTHPAAVLYDLANGQRLPGAAEGGAVSFALPAAAESPVLEWIVDERMAPALAATPLSLTLPETNGANYLILTHSLLRGEGDPVQAYADYRASVAGGSYRTAVVEVDQLYDLFGYGLQQHPLAIRNFLAWQRRVNPDFEFLFIIGKGREYPAIRTSPQLAEALGTTLFVPTFGFPGSDNLLVSSLTKPTPLVATGRLAATTPAEVQLYLRKIQDLERTVANAPQTIEGRGWMKQVLHLGGGSTAGEQQSIRSGLSRMADTLARSFFGGNTTSFYKTTTDPIQEALTTSIFDRINAGVSMITFFGHSSTNTFDFSIDNPANYANLGKYPLMLSLGCYSGNIHSASKSVGERFIFFPDKGAGAFGASRGLGFIHSLAAFGTRFYQTMGRENYGATIGEGLQAAIRTYENQQDIAFGALMEQFHLQGDPAIRLNPAEGPDYTIAPGSASFEPNIVNLGRDSFEVSFDLYNIGSFTGEDSLKIRIEQKLPDGNVVELREWRMEVPYYDQRVVVNLPTVGRDALGRNTLLITVDPDNEIQELPAPLAESNNVLLGSPGSIGVEFFVVDNSAIPVWPVEYAIVGETPSLRASTANPLIGEQKYYFELSARPDFSTLLTAGEVWSAGGVVAWQPALNWQDSTVYYWRVSPDSAALGLPDFNWERSSFIYLSDTWGWGQADWGQYAANSLNNLVLDVNERIDYVDDFRTLTIRNNIYSVGNANGFRPEGQVNNRRWSDFFRWNISPSLQVVVIDTVGVFWRNANPGQYGSVNTSTDVAIACFSFPVQSPEERTNLIRFLDEIIPDGHTVVVYNAIRNYEQDLAIDQWAGDSLANQGRNIFNVLEGQGAQLIRNLTTGDMRPYLLAYVKGGSVINEQIASDRDETVSYTFNIRGKWTEGNMVSRPIGPALNWNRLSWKSDLTSVHDTVKFTLLGLNAASEAVVLQTNSSPEGEIDLSEISAVEYPFLQLQYQTEDRHEYSSPQLDHWHISYQGVPDLAIDGQAGFAFQYDTLQRGQTLSLRLPIRNTTPWSIDTTRVRFEISGLSSEGRIWEEVLPPLRAGESFLLETTSSTENLRQVNQLSVEVNPTQSPREQYVFNNQAGLSFYVATDVIDPVALVTFDGINILDGDLVSAKPLVNISLTDENPYLPLDESSNIQLVLRYPSGSEELIPLRDERLSVRYPSPEADDNQLLIEWQPELTEDGTYTLKLRGQDREGNFNGTVFLEKRFEIITESRISNVLPYPNPFSTSTRFVYTLTGSVAPVDYKLQIMTISGRIVREVGADELGPLLIGTHLTDFVWDGTDAYGDALATGTYLYRFVVEDAQGGEMKHHSTAADRFFSSASGVGKVVILR